MPIAVTRTRVDRIKLLRDAFQALMWIAHRQFSQRLQSFGLTIPQFVTLASLAAHNQTCTMSDLTNVTMHDPPTMTGIVDRLVRMNLVERTRSETDRRVVLVQATENGVKLMEQIKAEVMDEELNMYSTLTDEDLTALERLLKQKLRLHVGQYRSLPDEAMDAELERLQRFINDPIQYSKLENQVNV